MLKKTNAQILRERVVEINLSDKNKNKSKSMSLEHLKSKASKVKDTFDEDYLRQEYCLQL